MVTPARAPIVVGIDPGPSHRLVLAWGADEADRRRVPLQLVHAQGRSPYGDGPGHRFGDGPARDRRSLAEHTLLDAAAFVADRHPCLEVSTLLAADDPVPLLRRHARTAGAVVLGSHRLRTREGLFTSASVALPVIAHAGCPVVVVRDCDQVAGSSPYFVAGVDVGADGRRHSAAAVDHAFAEAALHRAVLRVLYVWHPPLLGVLDEHAALRECRDLLSELVEKRRAAHPDVEVHHEVIRGRPAQVLARESAHALGLVVGVRGAGPTGVLLGSVVQGVLDRARCPVVAVPRDEGRRSARGGGHVGRAVRRAQRVAIRRMRRLAGFARSWPGLARRGRRSWIRHGGQARRGLGMRRWRRWAGLRW
ncbi:universal stress protein [Streptomyces sp. NPDC057616]|uniref:universal stress protein n=1 Tax=Streptomyces sp. NPDC057616 TaxID=3346183 RepID=UPI0036BD9518